MKKTVTVNRTLLQRVVAGVDGVVPRAVRMLPVAGLIQLTCSGTKMHITGTDTTAWLTGVIDLPEPVEANALVEAEKLVGAVSNADTDTVSLTFEGKPERVLVKYGRSTFRLTSVASTKQFPAATPAPDDALLVRLDGSRLAKAIRKVAFAAATNDVRHYLQSVAFQGSGTTLTLVATNGHQLAKVDIALDVTLPRDISALLPRELLGVLTKLCEADQVDLKFGSKLHVSAGAFDGMLPLIEASYPEWKRVVPAGHPVKVRADRQALLAAIRRTSFCLDKAQKGIVLDLDAENAKLKLSSQDTENNAVEDEIPVTTEGTPGIAMQYGISSVYLQEAVNVVESSEVEINLKDSNTALVVRDEKSPEWLSIIMPMRI